MKWYSRMSIFNYGVLWVESPFIYCLCPLLHLKCFIKIRGVTTWYQSTRFKYLGTMGRHLVSLGLHFALSMVLHGYVVHHYMCLFWCFPVLLITCFVGSMELWLHMVVITPWNCTWYSCTCRFGVCSEMPHRRGRQGRGGRNAQPGEAASGVHGGGNQGLCLTL